MNIRFFWLSAILIYPALFTACGEKGKPANPGAAPVAVNTYTAQEEMVVGLDAYPGTVVAENEVELRPQVAGYITNIYVKDGQAVKQGQKLYEIDRSKYQAAYRQAQADLKSAEANMDRAEKDLERYERLLERDAIARQQVDYARAEFKTAQSQVTSAHARIAGAATDLRYSVINAPFNGNIGISQVRIGSQVTPGQTLLNTISSNDPVSIDFVVNQKEIPRFNRMIGSDEGKDSTFTILLSDGSAYPHQGKIITIDRAVDRRTGSITVRLSTPNPERQLIPGMIVNIKVRNQDIGKQVVIPFKSVTEQLGEYYVFVVNGDSVNQRKLGLGTRFEDKVVVREGLKAGDVIVVEGIQRLRQGAKIQTGTAPPPAPPAGK